MEKQRLVELVLSAQRRDSSAVSELFNEFYNDVYYIALRETKNPDVSNDITQETFIKVIQNIESIKDPSVFVSWLKTIAYNESKRYYSKKDVKHEVLVDENEKGQTLFDEIKEDYRDFIPDEALDTVDLRETVMSFINELPQAQKTAFIMYYIDDFSVNEIAEFQGVSAGTVKSRLNYARKSVIESVNGYEKKHKIKLHSIPFLPMLKWLFENAKPTMPTETVATIAESVSSATRTAIATSSATASLTATTGIVTKIASLPIWTKVTAVIVATTVTVLGVLGVVIHNNNKQDIPPTITAVEETVPTTTLSAEAQANIAEAMNYHRDDYKTNYAGKTAVSYKDYIIYTNCFYNDDEFNGEIRVLNKITGEDEELIPATSEQLLIYDKYLLFTEAETSTLSVLDLEEFLKTKKEPTAFLIASNLQSSNLRGGYESYLKSVYIKDDYLYYLTEDEDVEQVCKMKAETIDTDFNNDEVTIVDSRQYIPANSFSLEQDCAYSDYDYFYDSNGEVIDENNHEISTYVFENDEYIYVNEPGQTSGIIYNKKTGEKYNFETEEIYEPISIENKCIYALYQEQVDDESGFINYEVKTFIKEIDI